MVFLGHVSPYHNLFSKSPWEDDEPKNGEGLFFRRTTFSLAFFPSLPLFLSYFLPLSEEGRREEGYDKNTPCGFSAVGVWSGYTGCPTIRILHRKSFRELGYKVGSRLREPCTWFHLDMWRKFTQPRVHLIAQFCTDLPVYSDTLGTWEKCHFKQR